MLCITTLRRNGAKLCQSQSQQCSRHFSTSAYAKLVGSDEERYSSSGIFRMLSKLKHKNFAQKTGQFKLFRGIQLFDATL
ncbi:hypothetical protein DLH87_25000 [Vibrio parahaemolyticus]|nr:hypothetical protein [Vibrio parahaemolyticus]EGR3168069.1 hypothetical protein [Vibrio parahaemolyticus]EGR3213900.1 hypothetical protein [Vibrio parahaemolyticus]EGR3469842.1 hypothetical protein [Vibrio parahaemolyticus]EGR3521633.1 hypothetical protein [Vibrio parahaemolyticus]